MVLAKKQLSKVVAIVLVAMCAVAFMPLLNGEAFAAAKVKTPAKVVIKTAKQSGNTMKVKVTWKKANNAKTYNVKIDKKVVKKGIKKVTYTSAALKAGTHKVYVQAVNGKKKGAWSKAKSFKIVDKKAAAVTIAGTPNVGETLTATVTNAAGDALTSGVTYQWYRVNNYTGVEAAIAGATKETYQIVRADGYGDATYTIYVEATAGGKTVKSAPTKMVTLITALDSVEIVLPNNHTAPQLGDTLSIKVKDVLGYDVDTDDVDIQWYVGGKKIKNATSSTYTIPATDPTKAYLDKVVTVVVTGDAGEYYGYTGEVTSVATAAIIKSTIPTGAEVALSAAAPYVGETLTAEFTPEGTSDADATYQWYRGNAKIAGATSASYTVTANDAGSTLYVEIQLSTEDDPWDPIEVGTVQPVLAKAKIEVAPSTGTVYTDDVSAVATITGGNAIGGDTPTVDTAFEINWYVDSVAEANQLFTTAYNAATQAQTAATAKELALDGTYYLYKATDATDLVGHKLIAVAKTTKAALAQGTVTSEATTAIGKKLSGTLTLSVDAAASTGKLIVGKSTMTVAGFTPANATVSYKWYRGDTEIAGATAASYAVTADDIGTNTYKVVVTGTGNYIGTLTVTSPTTYTVEANSGQEVAVSPVMAGGTEGSGDYAVFAQAGDTLTASASVAAAESYMTYTWTYTPASGNPATATGTSYTVPTTAKAGDVITLSATSSVADYVVTDTTPKAQVKSALTEVTLSSSADKAKTTVDAGHDGVAAPYVGETLKATLASGNATFQWYADGTKIDGATEATLPIGVSLYGKKITVEATGTGDYVGSKVNSAATGKVGAIGALSVSVGANDVVKVGNEVTATVTAYCYSAGELVESETDITSLATITWTTGVGTTTGSSYTFMADDAGVAWTCAATGIDAAADGALLVDYNTVVEE